ncbi:hypothetical protein HL666_24040 [Bradyrhizobium sp. 83002]|uniref:DUF4145 domain-containing protein n=1 Tax=Bradyrhizobium aeschynomenes TaxID=2734909 RepID=UPI001552D011|nr:DUF4145 domain-containing protein [Bradyrhizobium aeschynomenes]NPU13839.1 hypothetical protein [Bradyrhizobium aeschynomenes]
MDRLQFTSSIVRSLAWPIAAVTIVLIFRKQLQHLLYQVRKIGGAGLNVELATQVQEVQRAGEAVELEQGGALASTMNDHLDPTLAQLAKTFPEAAVLQEYKTVERILLQIREILPDKRPHRTLNEVLNKLADQGFVSETVVTLFQSVRQARNMAAHATDDRNMTSGEAIELIGQIKTLQNILDRVLEQIRSNTVDTQTK